MLSFWHVHAGDYARQAAAHSDVDIVAAWDEDDERGKSSRSADLGVDFHADLDELLARDDVDAVICDTPTDRHRDVLIAAANAGKHIFTEKVLAPTVKECNEILAAVDAAGVVLTLSLPRVYDDYTQSIRWVVDSGALGELTLARSRLSHDGATRGWLPAHFFDAAQCGGGALIDLGCHPMYLTRLFLGGMPESVSASFGFVTGREVEDNAVVSLRYPNGAVGVVEAGFVNRVSPFTIELHGTDGSLFFGTPEARLLVRGAGDATYTDVPIGDRPPMAFEQWVDHIKNGTKAEENVALGLDLTRLMEASNLSAREGRAVRLDSLTE